MQAADFNRLAQNPALLEKAHLPELQNLVKQFPYFQAAHILLSIGGKKFDAAVFQNSLKRTAIVVNNRTHLFNLVQAAENDNVRIVSQRKEETVSEKTPAEKAIAEIDVLKAAELTTAAQQQNDSETRTAKKYEVQSPETILEKEIGKQVVTAFVEKEILKIPDINKAPVTEEPESFGDWLSFLKKNNGQSYTEISGEVSKAKARKEKEKLPDPVNEEEIPDKKRKKMELIDKIIEKNPGLIRNKEEQRFYAPDLKAKESLLENEHLVTETLARIYALQGSVNKAIRAYEILSLKYPQKSAYFASLIDKLKNNHQ